MLDDIARQITAWVQQYGQWAALALGVLLLLLLVSRRGRRRPTRVRSSGPGVGAALHRALAGDLEGARQVLEQAVRAGGPGRRDALVGLVAVLNAQGEADTASALIDDLLKRTRGASWLIPLKVRLSLDAGRVEEAAAWARRTPELPMGLAIAALVRAGRWEEALARYEDRVPRKRRDAATWSALLAGCALEYMGMDQAKGARRALKRAESVQQGNLLTAVAGALVSAGEEARAEAATAAVRRAPWLSTLDETLFPIEASVELPVTEARVLEEAQAAFDAGEVERALGLLRSHLDDRPGAWRVRRRYDEWLLAHGEPADWKIELKEILANLPSDRAPVGQPMCGRCGYSEPEPFFICPRCDTLGALRPTAEGPPPTLPRRDPSSQGARLTDLVSRSHEERGEEPPWTPS